MSQKTQLWKPLPTPEVLEVWIPLWTLCSPWWTRMLTLAGWSAAFRYVPGTGSGRKGATVEKSHREQVPGGLCTRKLFAFVLAHPAVRK